MRAYCEIPGEIKVRIRKDGVGGESRRTNVPVVVFRGANGCRVRGWGGPACQQVGHHTS